MAAHNRSTTLLVMAVITLLTVLAFHVRVGARADAVAVLQTSGMTCSSCSAKIISALQALEGVSVTEVDVNGGWVVVGYDTQAVKPEALAEKVGKAGFTSSLYDVMSPQEYRKMTGRNVGQRSSSPAACGGPGCGCGMNK